MPERIVNLVAVLALTATLTGVGAVPILAKGDKPVTACPTKIGSFKFHEASVHLPGHYQSCSYRGPKKSRGSVLLSVSWAPDVHGERVRCESGDPQLTEQPSGSVDHKASLHSATRRVFGSYMVRDGKGISASKAAAALRKLIAAAEPLGNPCIPEDTPAPAAGLACPLVLPGGLVRGDWYRGDPPAIEAQGNPDDQRFRFLCLYDHAYADEGHRVAVEVVWLEGDPADPVVAYACRPNVTEFHNSTEVRRGYHPVEVEISNAFVERGGQALADRLEAAAAARTSRCLDAPEGPAPYEVDDVSPDADSATTPGTTTTTIVLSGGPGDEPPAVGATIAMPEDDQHRIVIGGLDGEIIREESLGDEATIIGYGPMARDADGNWSVSVEVEASTAPAPASPLPSAAPSAAPSSPLPSAVPSAAPSPAPVPSAEPTASAIAAPSPSPAVTPAPEPIASAEPDSSPTPVPPPEMIGMPEALADYVAGLEPEAAGVVRDLTDYLGWLGDDVVVTGQGEVTIPASAIAALRVLVPDLVDEIKLVSGGLIVDSYIEVRVTPVIGKDGLIEFRTNRLQDRIRSHEIVKALVMALNNYVVESGGRFRTISVTPEGLTVTAERTADG